MRSRSLHLIAIALIVLPYPVVPATITVDGTDGVVAVDGVCTLPEAIVNANDDAATHPDCAAGALADDILLSGNVTLTARNNGAPGSGNGLPVISSPMTIEGGGYAISRDPGSEAFRFFRIQAVGGDLTLNDVTVSGGLISNTSAISLGGAIFNNGGVLTLNNSTLAGNKAVAAGTSYAYGGALYNKGIATLTNSAVTDNAAEVIDVDLSGQRALGGGIANCALGCFGQSPDLILTGTTVSGNSATVITPVGSTDTGGAYGGGVYNFDGSATLTNSTVSNNSVYVSDETGFALASGGGVLVVYADLFLVNSTLSGNATAAPGADALGAAIDYFGFGTNPAIEISNTLLGNHLTGYTCFSIDGTQDFGNNLADDTTCGTIPDTLTGLDPALMNNGGPTQTNALMPGSTAIDAAGDCGLAEDQRGVPRPVGFCDSGSFELLDCSAPQGEDFIVPDGITSTEETFETCTSLTVNDRDVVAPDGHLILRTAGTVVINNGFQCGVGARLTVENDDLIVMPDQQ